jgi:flagellar basal body-associated protein FliL
MTLPKHNQQCKIDPPNQPSSRALLWIILAVVIATFIAIVMLRPALQLNSSPTRSAPAGPSQ